MKKYVVEYFTTDETTNVDNKNYENYFIYVNDTDQLFHRDGHGYISEVYGNTKELILDGNHIMLSKENCVDNEAYLNYVDKKHTQNGWKFFSYKDYIFVKSDDKAWYVDTRTDEVAPTCDFIGEFDSSNEDYLKIYKPLTVSDEMSRKIIGYVKHYENKFFELYQSCNFYVSDLALTFKDKYRSYCIVDNNEDWWCYNSITREIFKMKEHSKTLPYKKVHSYECLDTRIAIGKILRAKKEKEEMNNSDKVKVVPKSEKYTSQDIETALSNAYEDYGLILDFIKETNDYMILYLKEREFNEA